MEVEIRVINDALRYVGQAKKLLENICDEDTLNEIRNLLNNAEEALVKAR